MTDTPTTNPITSPQPGVGNQFSMAVRPLGQSLAPVGARATLGGLLVYFVVSLAEPDFFYATSALTWVKLVLLICGGAAVVDAFRPSTMAAAIANIGTVFVLGSGVLTLVADTWGGPIVWRLLLVLADGALAVGFVAFLGRASDERAEASTTSMFETVVLVLGGIALLLALIGNLDWFAERYALRLAGIWLVIVAAIVAVLLTRSRPGLVTGGLGALVVGLGLFSEYHRYNLGAVRWPLLLVLVGTTGLAAWQFNNLRLAPTIHLPIEPVHASVVPTAGAGAPAGQAEPHAVPTGAPNDYASFGARLIAAIVDGMIFSVATIALYALLIGAVAQESVSLLVLAFIVPIVLDVVLLVWYCRRTARTGQSWGKSAAGIYLVKTTTGRPPSAWGVFGRGLASWISALPCYLGYFWMLWDPARQTWHDKIAGTVVVKTMVASSAAPAPTAPPIEQSALRSQEPVSPAEQPPTVDVSSAPTPPAGPPPSVFPLDEPSQPRQADVRPPVEAAPGQVPSAGPSPSVVSPPGEQRPPSQPAVRPITSGMPFASGSSDDLTIQKPARRIGATLAVSDGRSVIVESLLLVGRDPEPGPEDGRASVLPITGDLMVSKTHLAVGASPTGAWVQDRNSTNGVTVTRADQAHALVPGRRFDLQPGDRIDFGEHWLRVEDG